MKKLLASLLAVGMAASVVNAQEVFSRNAVGYVKQEIEQGKIYLVGTPFVNLDNGSDLHLLTNVLAAAPNNSIVSIWDDGLQSYVSFGRGARGTWDGAAQTAQVARGSAMFLRIPSAAGTNEIVFMGEVPDDETAPTTFQERVPGLTFLSYPYPASVLFTSTQFAISAPNNAIVSIWDAVAQTYVSYGKGARGTWDGAAQIATIQPGQAFIIRSAAAASDWNEVKPYTWP